MKYQIMDTPGLLDREHRNEAEMQAVLALELVSNLVLVVMDFNEYCGITLADQVRFFEKMKNEYEKIPVIPVESKMDVGLDYTRSKEYKKFLDEHDIQEPLRVSALTGEGIEELRERLVVILDSLAPERKRF
jgi:nucleolar GTP-binding protein